MSYTLPVVIVNETNEALTVVDCWYYANSGTWTEEKCDKIVLEMGGSGTSGMLRIKTSSGTTFSVIVGCHNYDFWCDAQVDLYDDDTPVKLHPEYYNGGILSHEPRSIIERTTSAGRTVRVYLQGLPCGRPPVIITYC